MLYHIYGCAKPCWLSSQLSITFVSSLTYTLSQENILEPDTNQYSDVLTFPQRIDPTTNYIRPTIFHLELKYVQFNNCYGIVLLKIKFFRSKPKCNKNLSLVSSLEFGANSYVMHNARDIDLGLDNAIQSFEEELYYGAYRVRSMTPRPQTIRWWMLLLSWLIFRILIRLLRLYNDMFLRNPCYSLKL